MSRAIAALAHHPVCRPEVAAFIHGQMRRYAETGQRPCWPVAFTRQPKS